MFFGPSFFFSIVVASTFNDQHQQEKTTHEKKKMQSNCVVPVVWELLTNRFLSVSVAFLTTEFFFFTLRNDCGEESRENMKSSFLQCTKVTREKLLKCATAKIVFFSIQAAAIEIE